MLQQFILVTFFIFTLRFFQSTPFEEIFFQLHGIYLAVVALFMFYYITLFSARNRWRNREAIYFVLMAIVLPIYYGVQAYLEFAQPLIYGVLAGRGLVMLGAGVFLWYLIVRKTISIRATRSFFIGAAWASLIIFSYFYLTIDPSTVELEEGEKLMRMSQDRGLRFKFQTFFITFGVFYYFTRYILDRRLISLMAFLMFLAYIAIFVQGRVYTISVAATLVIYIFFSLPFQKAVSVSLQVLILAALALFAMYILVPGTMETLAHIYKEMFVALSGTESTDFSANSRIYQTAAATAYLSEHPWSILFGTGSVSHHWNNGYDSILGYFYPSDTGLVGAFFVHGVIGVVTLMLIPMVIVYRFIRMRIPKTDVYLKALKLMLVYSLIRIPAGHQFFAFVEYLLPLFILIAWQTMRRQQKLYPAYTVPHRQHSNCPIYL